MKLGDFQVRHDVFFTNQYKLMNAYVLHMFSWSYKLELHTMTSDVLFRSSPSDCQLT